MKLWKEFRDFAFKGNVIDLAVGVMIGAAFGSIVTSAVNDLFTPLISLITGKVDFSTLGVVMGSGTPPRCSPTVRSSRRSSTSCWSRCASSSL